MTIAPAILLHYPDLSDAQRAVVGHVDGPVLVIAGPGSGKTYSIVLRALNLLLLGRAEPKQVVLCTFTEKAAFEMRDRLAAAARKVSYPGDLSELTVSTIHSLCNRVLMEHRHRTPLGHSFETLDELTQLLFIFEHFDEIIGPAETELFLGHWKTRWTAIEGARGYFDKMTEELVDPAALMGSTDSFLVAVGKAYRSYEKALVDANRIDFAHLQSIPALLGTHATAWPVSPLAGSARPGVDTPCASDNQEMTVLCMRWIERARVRAATLPEKAKGAEQDGHIPASVGVCSSLTSRSRLSSPARDQVLSLCCSDGDDGDPPWVSTFGVGGTTLSLP